MTEATTPKKYYDAWQKNAHWDLYSKWTFYTLRELKLTLESFNEIRLFQKYESTIKGREFVDVGCATGEISRYLKRYHPRFDYFGFDISQNIIRATKHKYPERNLFALSGNLSEIPNRIGRSPAIVFSRDVVIHQTDPLSFLTQLISLPLEAAILRIRTKDKGKTVLDPEISRQWHYNEWVPYMVLNMDEVIDLIKRTVPFEKLHILKSYKVLGGKNKVVLPKDCYAPETGTAETAIYIQKADGVNPASQVIIETRADNNPKYLLWDYVPRLVRAIRQRRLL